MEFCEYEESSWPEKSEEPTGFTFRGKKRGFEKAVENIKILMKRGTKRILNKLTMIVMDSRTIPHGNEMDIEVSNEKEKGVAVLRIFGPNSKKECTIVASNKKKSDLIFVKILAKDIIKPLIDKFISGEGWINLFCKVNSNKKVVKENCCIYCDKGFKTDKNL